MRIWLMWKVGIIISQIGKNLDCCWTGYYRGTIKPGQATSWLVNTFILGLSPPSRLNQSALTLAALVQTCEKVWLMEVDEARNQVLMNDGVSSNWNDWHLLNDRLGFFFLVLRLRGMSQLHSLIKLNFDVIFFSISLFVEK